MGNIRDTYSEEIEKKYRRMERSHNQIVQYFEGSERSKSSEEVLDPAYDFFLNCYHLREHIQKDSLISQDIKDTLPTFEAADSPIQFLMCRDLCNKSKHATLDAWRNPNDTNTKIVPYGNSLFIAKGNEIENAQRKKETLHLKSEDEIFIGNFAVFFRGNLYELKGVVQACMYIWRKFFEDNNLLLPRTTPYE